MAVQTQRIRVISSRAASRPVINIRWLALSVTAALVGFVLMGMLIGGGWLPLLYASGNNHFAPPLLQGSCGDGSCDGDEDSDSCPQDCDDGGGEDPYCGDGDCNGGEDSDSCSEDCGGGGGEDPYCGDGSCNGDEDSSSCPGDCGGGGEEPFCGDGACNGDEDADSCAADCGGGGEEPFCGDGACNGEEDSDSCAEDCEGGEEPFCGDGACNGDEDPDSCSADCEEGGGFCGDGVCDGDSGEDADNCYDDCGDGGAVCGDGFCDWDAGEDPSSCSEDCYEAICGDGYCDPSAEDSDSCAEDCGEYESYCGDSICDPASGEDADWCPEDCEDFETVCGDGFCDYDNGEDEETCEDDCASDIVCGDGYCDPDGDEDSETCAYDCGFSACGDGFCDPNIEDEEICPYDCTSGYEAICGDGFCDEKADEDPDSCAFDCSKEYDAACGDGFCDPDEEDADSCAQDCEEALSGPASGTATAEAGATSTPGADPTEESEAGFAATEEAEIITAYRASDLPENCRLVPYDDIEREIADAMDSFSDSLTLISSMVLVCERESTDVCVPYPGAEQDPAQVQIVSCGADGACHVYRAVSIRKMSRGSAVCISARFGRPMPTCTGACAAASGLTVTETDVSGYVFPFAMLMGIVTVSGVGGAFIMTRRRNRELDEEISGFEPGVVTKRRESQPMILPVTGRQEEDLEEDDLPETIRINTAGGDMPTKSGTTPQSDDDDTQVDDGTIRLERPE